MDRVGYLQLNVLGLSWNTGSAPQRSGSVRVRFESLADYKAATALLDSGINTHTPRGRIVRFGLSDPFVPEPKDFPTEVDLAIKEQGTPFGVDQYAWLTSNELQTDFLVQLKEFTPPSESGVVHMTVLCDSIEEFTYLRLLLEGPHQAVLKSTTGFVASVRLMDEDVAPRDQFPRLVTFRVHFVVGAASGHNDSESTHD
jgi:hypothetical protein